MVRIIDTSTLTPQRLASMTKDESYWVYNGLDVCVTEEILQQLLPQLDAGVFWQIHRGTVVRASEIRQAVRDEAGRVTLHLRSRPERLAVSRLYAGRFKGM